MTEQTEYNQYQEVLDIHINSSQISTGVYSLLYTYIKTVYTNTSDDL